jgi:hypothetical protein
MIRASLAARCASASEPQRAQREPPMIRASLAARCASASEPQRTQREPPMIRASLAARCASASEPQRTQREPPMIRASLAARCASASKPQRAQSEPPMIRASLAARCASASKPQRAQSEPPMILQPFTSPRTFVTQQSNFPSFLSPRPFRSEHAQTGAEGVSPTSSPGEAKVDWRSSPQGSGTFNVQHSTCNDLTPPSNFNRLS